MMIDESFGVTPNSQGLSIMQQWLYQYDPLDKYIVDDEPRVNCIVWVRGEGFDINIKVDDGDMRSLTVEGADTIFALHGYARRAGIPWGDKYYFTWNGELLIGTRTLHSYGIYNSGCDIRVGEKG
ncbi:hypothetical protein FRX31_013459 [Thalictrum thalictroides]|uniref:Ubiquitin-like domain-containing protein n=1 Tax=Thalictrum thalictroides TaxID=46969 RepID=A0A7J6WHM6_THATH|nr:hypothetical protein FRX31_013459 [Thalictrum thalictroides]